MREHDDHHERYDAFGWLKTLGIIVMLFAMMIGSSIITARADQCAEGCRSKNNECRIQTKGSRECDVKHNACIQSCVATLSAPTLQQNLIAPKKK